jgi:hypothetical protein
MDSDGDHIHSQKEVGPKPTKEEKAVASHVRFNCPTKTTMVAGDEVHYFTGLSIFCVLLKRVAGTKAIDCLMASKWSIENKKNAKPLFVNRATAVAYMQT